MVAAYYIAHMARDLWPIQNGSELAVRRRAVLSPHDGCNADAYFFTGFPSASTFSSPAVLPFTRAS